MGPAPMAGPAREESPCDPLIAATTTRHGGGGFLLYSLLFYIVFYLPVWGTYKKAAPQGQPAWAAFIPIYQWIVLLRVAGRPKSWGWFLLLYLIPYVGWLALFIVAIIVIHDVSKSFGHGAGFTVGLVFLPIPIVPVIFWFILWLGKSTYRGPQGPAALAGSFGAEPGYPTQAGYPPAPAGYPQQGGYAPPPPPPGAGYPPAPQPGTAYPAPPPAASAGRFRTPAAASPATTAPSGVERPVAGNTRPVPPTRG